MINSAKATPPEPQTRTSETDNKARMVSSAHRDQTASSPAIAQPHMRWTTSFDLQKQSGLPRQLELQAAGHSGHTLKTEADLGALSSNKKQGLAFRHFGRIKRLADVFVSGAGLIALAPMFLAIAAIIKMTSTGPVFFSQPRYGRNNELFQIYKFRTMYVKELDPSGIKQTTEDDPRVTPFGGFLRRTSLDEFPQLINVLIGDMSLVGPRPHVPGMMAGGILYEQLVPEYFARHAIRPGITGLAQVTGLRGSTIDPDRARRRISCDLTYIENASLVLDAWIFLETVRREFLFGNGN